VAGLWLFLMTVLGGPMTFGAVPTADEIIEHYGMQGHPEGGFFLETYRSKNKISKSALRGNFSGDRSESTAIYFLLKSNSRSQFHRIKSDETWHFYLGGPLTLVEIDDDGALKKTVIGQDLSKGQTVQYTVRAGNWFGAFPNDGTAYSFVGCTVAPGFDFADFELAKRSDLLKTYPQHKEIISKLTPEQ
jgi:uncharacterized protein